MKDCLFCRIIRGEVPASAVYEDEDMLIIKDIDPKAAHHYLLLPKRHFRDILEMSEADSQLLARCLMKVRDLTGVLDLTGGFRMVINQGEDAGQTVPHLHIHILSGQKMNWQPA